MSGSFGSFRVKFDRTQESGVREFKIRARSRGLITAEQDVKFINCPKSGGAFASAADDSLTVSIDQRATGTAANANFLAWTIDERVSGCG
jgi:hypothetical protein